MFIEDTCPSIIVNLDLVRAVFMVLNTFQFSYLTNYVKTVRLISIYMFSYVSGQGHRFMSIMLSK